MDAVWTVQDKHRLNSEQHVWILSLHKPAVNKLLATSIVQACMVVWLITTNVSHCRWTHRLYYITTKRKYIDINKTHIREVISFEQVYVRTNTANNKYRLGVVMGHGPSVIFTAQQSP